MLTDQNTDEMNIVFDHAIDVANEELGLAMTSLKAEVNYGDAYHSYGKLCRMLEVGLHLCCLDKYKRFNSNTICRRV